MPTATKDKAAKKEEERKPPTPGERLDILENAFRLKLGVDLSEFDPQAVLDARAAAAEKLAEEIAAAEEKAAEAIGKPLTEKQRMERIEAALRAQDILPAAAEEGS
jgi:hypothetical protein